MCALLHPCDIELAPRWPVENLTGEARVDVIGRAQLHADAHTRMQQLKVRFELLATLCACTFVSPAVHGPAVLHDCPADCTVQPAVAGAWWLDQPCDG
jgi:hypothetical protein